MMSLNYKMVRIILCSVRYSRLYRVHHKKLKKLPTNPPIHIYIHIIKNRLVFNIKDGYILELQMLDTIKLFGSTKNVTDKTKNGENVPNIEVVEVVLVECNLADNQYQQKV